MSDPLLSLDAWRGRLRGRVSPVATVTLRAPTRPAKSSGAGAFLGLADDGNQYWVKVPGNPQGDQILVNEVIVAELGRLLDAPVRQRCLISVPPGLTGWQHFPRRRSDETLLAHGSLHVPGAIDDDELRYTKKDDNARRQACMLGLWDLCLGGDPQWLYDATAAYSMWSYDHGFWFTTQEGDWDASVLRRLMGIDGSLDPAPAGLDRRAIAEVARRILAMSADDLLGAVSAVPVDWDTDDGDLEAMAWFVYSRREAVAGRLERSSSSESGGRSTGHGR